MIWALILLSLLSGRKLFGEGGLFYSLYQKNRRWREEYKVAKRHMSGLSKVEKQAIKEDLKEYRRIRRETQKSEIDILRELLAKRIAGWRRRLKGGKGKSRKR